MCGDTGDIGGAHVRRGQEIRRKSNKSRGGVLAQRSRPRGGQDGERGPHMQLRNAVEKLGKKVGWAGARRRH